MKLIRAIIAASDTFTEKWKGIHFDGYHKKWYDRPGKTPPSEVYEKLLDNYPLDDDKITRIFQENGYEPYVPPYSPDERFMFNILLEQASRCIECGTSNEYLMEFGEQEQYSDSPWYSLCLNCLKKAVAEIEKVSGT